MQTGSAPCPSEEINRTTVYVSKHSYNISRNALELDRSIAVALLWLDVEVVSRNITPRDRCFTQSDSLDPSWARNTINEVVKGVVKFIERQSRYPRLSPDCAAIHTYYAASHLPVEGAYYDTNPLDTSNRWLKIDLLPCPPHYLHT